MNEIISSMPSLPTVLYAALMSREPDCFWEASWTRK